ncbi:MAG: hypothetical protein J6Q85_03555 [Clostridia bacterium]|nr:hypothetical protein [Clostridia bacterium]
MASREKIVVFSNIKLPINASVEEAFIVAKRRLKRISPASATSELFLFRRSIDARRRGDIRIVYSIAAKCEGTDALASAVAAEDNVSLVDTSMPELSQGERELSSPPVIVGAGPAGIFAALMLAQHGYAPVILERGGSVAERTEAVRRFTSEHILDVNSNVQFGAGGAGTFSDGKLVTRINDPLSAYVLERFVEFGAPEEIKYMARPHVGTDVLSGVVDRMLDKIVALGGRVEYHTQFISPVLSGRRITAVKTSRGEIPTGALVLAVGHSARDTYSELIRLGAPLVAKDFSVGMRIEHLSSDIDEALYGDSAAHPSLGRAEYNLSTNTKSRGVYTFCMCPGGEVVAAASEEHGVVVNGMSNHSRDGRNSNSAVVCSVFKSDYGATPESAIAFQRKIERDAYIAAGGDYRAPIITVGDFLRGELKTEPKRIQPTYMGGKNVTLASPDLYLPSFVSNSIRGALVDFDKRIKGFAASDAVLTGAETRTSAPIRILRDNDTRIASGYDNLYPAGEGAGYAGGITSAAIDGIRTAMALIKEYKPFDNC